MQSVIETINSKISALYASEFKRKKAQLFGLAESIVVTGDEDETLPAVIDDNGECTYILQDDRFGLGVYHKCLQKTYLQENGFGDEKANVCICEMVLICYAERSLLKRTAQYIEENLIIPSFPAEVLPTKTDFNSQRVMATEFRMPIGPDQFIFAVNYKFKVRSACRK